MPKKNSYQYRLRKSGIRSFDKLIHDQPKEWLIKNFSQGADEYPINVSLLMRNLVWQMKTRIAKGEKQLLDELIRTYWYMYVKPTLSRAGALSQKTDQYPQLIETIVTMVKDLKLMQYKDIGFADDKESHRNVGGNPNIIVFSEKIGHQKLLNKITNKYNVSTLALGGQPSVMNIEYFVDDLKTKGINLKRSFYLFSIVDYDPSGWIIRDAFLNNLKFYGIANTKVIDLIHPDMLTKQEIKTSRYEIKAQENMRVKNQNWLKQVYKRHYKNQRYLEKRTIQHRKIKKLLYGLEAEAISTKRLLAALDQHITPILGKTEDYLKLHELKNLEKAVDQLILYKMKA